MKTSGAILIATVTAAALALFMGLGTAQTPRPAPVARVAVCDVSAVFNGYLKKQTLNDELDRRIKKAQEDSKKRSDAVQAAVKTLKQLKPGTAEYRMRVKELEKLAIQQEGLVGIENKLIGAERRRMMVELYKDVLPVVAEVAKARGIDVVLDSEKVDLATQGTAELFSKIGQRKCLYHNPRADITQAVLTRLNRAYGAKPK